MAKQGRNIFLKNGKPMTFYVPAGVKKGELSDLITRHGGKVVRDDKAADVVLWEKTFHNDGGNRISKKFVYDSVESGKLQDNLVYVIKKTPKKPKTPKKGRTGFTATDDRVLLDLVSKNPESARGNKIYKELEVQNRRHTWQSWRDRYVKVLAPNQRKSMGPSESSNSLDKPGFKKRRLSKPESNSDSDNDQPLTQAMEYQDVDGDEGEEEEEEEDADEMEEEEDVDESVSDNENEISTQDISSYIKSENDSDTNRPRGPLETQGIPVVKVTMTESFIIDDSDEDNTDKVLYEEVTENTYSLDAEMEAIDDPTTSKEKSGKLSTEENELPMASDGHNKRSTSQIILERVEYSQGESIQTYDSYEEITQQTQEDMDEEFESQDYSSLPTSEPNVTHKNSAKEQEKESNLEKEIQAEEDVVMASQEEEHDADMESQDIQPLTQRFDDTIDESMEDLSQDFPSPPHESEEEEEEGFADDRLTQLEQAQQESDFTGNEARDPKEVDEDVQESKQSRRESVTKEATPKSDELKPSSLTASKVNLDEHQLLRAASTPITRARSHTPTSNQQNTMSKTTRARSNTPAVSSRRDRLSTMDKSRSKPPTLPHQQNSSNRVPRDQTETPAIPHQDDTMVDNQDDTFDTYKTVYLRMIKGLCITTKSTPEEVIQAIKLTSGNFVDAEKILIYGQNSKGLLANEKFNVHN
ncbi:hypothetical protein K7432_003142 [Basidiobolus ranarum]|uniref:DNA-binding protein RAP1 n=1 Tax=Basidiobolus ranarum TaxID=34480 RepID=A0ABR2X0C6_9FUNG